MDFDFADDGEDYDFDYEEEDETGDAAQPSLITSLENQYYAAKALKLVDPDAATAAFQAVVTLQEELSEWGFRALKQICKTALSRGDLVACLSSYKELLTYTQNVVTRNHADKSINAFIDRLCQGDSINIAFLEAMYELTRTALIDQQNQRLLLKVRLKVAKVYLDQNSLEPLNDMLSLLERTCEEEIDQQRRDTAFLEILALKIQYHTKMNHTNQLKKLYQQSLRVGSAIPHPRIVAVIRECGGKMHLNQKEWTKAQIDFFEAFKSYDEAGDSRRIDCMKYLVLASMLTESAIDPFESQETKPLRNLPEIVTLTSLVDAFQQRNLTLFSSLLHEHRSELLQDQFVRMHIEKIERIVRGQVLVDYVKPYKRLTLAAAAERIGSGIYATEKLIIKLILDGKIHATIDQVTGIINVVPSKRSIERFVDMKTWAQGIERTCKALIV